MGVVACGAGFFIEKRTLAIEVGAGKQKSRPVTSGRRIRAGRPGARLAESRRPVPPPPGRQAECMGDGLTHAWVMDSWVHDAPEIRQHAILDVRYALPLIPSGICQHASTQR